MFCTAGIYCVFRFLQKCTCMKTGSEWHEWCHWWLWWVISSLLDGCLLAAFHKGTKGTKTLAYHRLLSLSHLLFNPFITSLFFFFLSLWNIIHIMWLLSSTAKERRCGRRENSCVCFNVKAGGRLRKAEMRSKSRITLGMNTNLRLLWLLIHFSLFKPNWNKKKKCHCC